MNLEMMRKLRNRFRRLRHPEHFNMKQVAVKTDCGAAMCMIGHTLNLAGYKMRKKTEPNYGSPTAASRTDYDFIAPDGRWVPQPYNEAQELLGLNNDTAAALFHDWTLKTPAMAVTVLERLMAGEQVYEGD